MSLPSQDVDRSYLAYALSIALFVIALIVIAVSQLGQVLARGAWWPPMSGSRNSLQSIVQHHWASIILACAVVGIVGRRFLTSGRTLQLIAGLLLFGAGVLGLSGVKTEPEGCASIFDVRSSESSESCTDARETRRIDVALLTLAGSSLLGIGTLLRSRD